MLGRNFNCWVWYKYNYQANSDRLLTTTNKLNNSEQNKKTSYRYDLEGNPTLISNTQSQDNQAQKNQERHFSYGARGQLNQIRDGDDIRTDYRYNYAMQRVSKTIANDEQRYLWQQGLLDAEIEVNDN